MPSTVTVIAGGFHSGGMAVVMLMFAAAFADTLDAVIWRVTSPREVAMGG